MVVGGYGSSQLTSVELFPRPLSDTCFIPDLPQGREYHSLSLLSGGRLVVCGGEYYDGSWIYIDSCISWVAGNTSWTPLYTMRCLPIIMDKPASDCYSDLLLFQYLSTLKQTHAKWGHNEDNRRNCQKFGKLCYATVAMQEVVEVRYGVVVCHWKQCISNLQALSHDAKINVLIFHFCQNKFCIWKRCISYLQALKGTAGTLLFQMCCIWERCISYL